MKMFGFKAYSAGSHTLIAGHIATKMGNGEFSASFNHSDSDDFNRALRELSSLITKWDMIERCNHRFELRYTDTDNRSIVGCSFCGYEGLCFHRDTTVVSGAWDSPDAVYECLTCKYQFTYEKGTQTKVPYVRPTQPDVRTGEGSGNS